jgi:hypothetical protein
MAKTQFKTRVEKTLDLLISRVESKVIQHFVDPDVPVQNQNYNIKDYVSSLPTVNSILKSVPELKKTAREFRELTSTLAELYLIKAANIYAKNLFKPSKAKKPEQVIMEGVEQANQLVGCVADLNQDIRLNPEYHLNSSDSDLLDDPHDRYGYKMNFKFPPNTVKFVNDNVEFRIRLRRKDKEIGKPSYELSRYVTNK